LRRGRHRQRPWDPHFNLVAVGADVELGVGHQLDDHPGGLRARLRQRRAPERAVLDLQLAGLGGDLAVGEVDHHPRRRGQLQGGEGERPIALDDHAAGPVVASRPHPQQTGLLLRRGPESECESAVHECERRPAHAGRR